MLTVKTDEETVLVTAGKKWDSCKSDWSLMPWRGLEPVIRVLMFGAEKYGRNNWQAVDDSKRRYLAAAYRHINAYAEGDEKDNESQLPHLAHAVCCLLFILWFGGNND